MPDLRVDVGMYAELGSELGRVATEFADANTNSDRIADAVGHSGLADAVRDFAHQWDDKRKAMTGDIQTLAKFATEIGEGFGQTDQALGDAVSGQ
ncbi:hypothetical protein GCM10022288_21400 [Gryllotalpicola kribbensis]|jgi:hypothetical protein|uniref:WXG100 family type VII secretion target n=1 Tax=Gryllotalpicola kribbensis TaxID=993084 RepID=A0ABP8AUW9_9MICO